MRRLIISFTDPLSPCDVMTWSSPYDANKMAEGYYRAMYVQLKQLAKNGYREPVGKVKVWQGNEQTATANYRR